MAIKELFDRAYGKASQHIESEQHLTVDYEHAREQLRDLVIKLATARRTIEHDRRDVEGGGALVNLDVAGGTRPN
jgi:hypothetical protein